MSNPLQPDPRTGSGDFGASLSSSAGFRPSTSIKFTARILPLTGGLLVNTLAGCAGCHAAGAGLGFVALQLAPMAWNADKDPAVAALCSA